MKIINNTTGTLHWDTSVSSGGGDCGDLAPGASYNYPLGAGETCSFSVVTTNAISYDNVGSDALLVISSRLEDGGAKR
jgi:hypothetical protein